MINLSEGIVLAVDKPLGWSSFHVVKKLRGILSERLRKVGVRKIKVGHAGTLDPLATGVMVMCFGKATKTIDQLQAGVKGYIAEITLGATTPSFDMETGVDATYPIEHITEELVKATLKKFIGRIEQVPPTYSACKVDGKRAYKLARTGAEVDLKPKVLVIDSIDLLEYSQEKITIKVICSKGTYIRALARDIGLGLNSGAYLSALRRTMVGDYVLDNTLPVEDAARMLGEYPMCMLDVDGNSVDVPPIEYRQSTNSKADIKTFEERQQKI